MSKIFAKPGSKFISDVGDKQPKLASVHVTSGTGAASARLPLVSIGEMSHHARQQLDCSLDGTVHVLTATGGLGACTITFMDRVGGNCGGGSDRSLSALHQYGKLRKSLTGSRVVVTIHGSDGSSTLAKFTGIVKSCTATAQRRQGIDVLLVTYVLQGVMNSD